VIVARTGLVVMPLIAVVMLITGNLGVMALALGIFAVEFAYVLWRRNQDPS
jgi:hypothetical protein